MIDSRLPVSSRKQLQFDGFRVYRALIHAGAFPANPGGELRIIATLGGGWELQVQHGKKVHYSHGEVCLLPATLRRHATFRAAGDNLLISVEDTLLERLAMEAGAPEAVGGLQFQTLSDPMVYQITNALAEEIGLDGPHGMVYTESLVLSLLGYLLRGRMSIARDAAVEGGLSPRKLRLCELYVESHLGNELSVEEIARAVTMSTFHFTRAFKKSTGKTPHRYVTERRIAVAQQMVVNTDRPLNEISAELGFCSPSHFSTVFQAVTGITPSAARRK